MSATPAVDRFRAASDGWQQEALAGLQRRAEALGPVGQFDAVMELAGSVGKWLLEAAPIAQTQTHVDTRVDELSLYLSSANRAPQ